MFFLVSSAFVYADEKNKSCREVTMRFIDKGVTKIKKLKLCEVQKEQNKYIVSPECLNDDCPPLRGPRKKVVLESRFSDVGTPGFKVCHKIGGIPQIFEYHKENPEDWIRADRCMFDDEGKYFVETSHLFLLWYNHIKNN